MLRFYTERPLPGVLTRWVDITQHHLLACRHELRMIRKAFGCQPINSIVSDGNKITLKVLLGSEKWPIQNTNQ